jgi:hypothetical protein
MLHTSPNRRFHTKRGRHPGKYGVFHGFLSELYIEVGGGKDVDVFMWRDDHFSLLRLKFRVEGSSSATSYEASQLRGLGLPQRAVDHPLSGVLGYC